MLTQRQYVQDAGMRAVIWIDPARIDQRVTTKWPVGKGKIKRLNKVLPVALTNIVRPWFKQREPFVIPEAYFTPPSLLADVPRHQKMADFVDHYEDVRASQWYRELSADLKRKGKAQHKKIVMRSDADIMDFMENYAASMVRSLKVDGFLEEKSTYESSAVIGPDGGLLKAGSGNHRFSICQILGLPRFPIVVVAAHEEWVAKTLGGDVSVDSVVAALGAVETAHR